MMEQAANSSVYTTTYATHAPSICVTIAMDHFVMNAKRNSVTVVALHSTAMFAEKLPALIARK
jgi:hypothetical protein